MQNNRRKIKVKMKAPECCKKPMELKFVLSDLSFNDRIYFQCKQCGYYEKIRVL